MGLICGARVGNDHGLPKVELGSGRRVILPAMLPLAWLSILGRRWPHAALKFHPRWSHHETVPIQDFCGPTETETPLSAAACQSTDNCARDRGEALVCHMECVGPRRPKSCGCHPGRKPQSKTSPSSWEATQCTVPCFDGPCHLGDHAKAMPWPLSFPRRASWHIRGIGREAEFGGGGDNEVRHIGAEPATRIAGRERWEWRPTILARFAIVPRTSLARMRRIPTVCPGFSLPAGSTPLAQAPQLRVGRRLLGSTPVFFPACKWIPTLVEGSFPSVSYPVRVRSGSDTMYTSSKNARRCSSSPIVLLASDRAS